MSVFPITFSILKEKVIDFTPNKTKLIYFLTLFLNNNSLILWPETGYSEAKPSLRLGHPIHGVIFLSTTVVNVYFSQNRLLPSEPESVQGEDLI